MTLLADLDSNVIIMQKIDDVLIALKRHRHSLWSNAEEIVSPVNLHVQGALVYVVHLKTEMNFARISIYNLKNYSKFAEGFLGSGKVWSFNHLGGSNHPGGC